MTSSFVLNSKAKKFSKVLNKNSADPGKMNWRKKKSPITFNKSNHEKVIIMDVYFSTFINFLYH
jgi:hypothetical protein